MKSSKLLTSAVAVLVGCMAMPSVASASNDDDTVTCSLRTLRGVYEFNASGFNITNGVALPKAIIEKIVFDGHGNVSTPAVSLSVNGNIIQPPQGSPGVYTVDANCTGTLTFADGPMFKLHIKPETKSFTMLQINPGTVMQGTAVRVLPLNAWGG